jgi:UDP-N-acetyl-D-glucosamine dehydrogenase
VSFPLSPAGARLRERISARESQVAVIGAGYVGLPLAVRLATVGFAVVCVDQDPERVGAINAGRSYIGDVADDDLAPLVAAGRLSATSSSDDLGRADVIVACLPTPVTRNKEPDISAIRKVAAHLAAHVRPGQLISLESTTYPGTVEEVLLPPLAATGLQVGVDFFLCHSPERVDPGNPHLTIANTSKVVGGVTRACLEVASFFYEQIVPRVVRVSSPRWPS